MNIHILLSNIMYEQATKLEGCSKMQCVEESILQLKKALGNEETDDQIYEIINERFPHCSETFLDYMRKVIFDFSYVEYLNLN